MSCGPGAFGSDPAIVDRTITLDGEPARVVGVMPVGFDFPRGTELWTAAVPRAGFGERRLEDQRASQRRCVLPGRAGCEKACRRTPRRGGDLRHRAAAAAGCQQCAVRHGGHAVQRFLPWPGPAGAVGGSGRRRRAAADRVRQRVGADAHTRVAVRARQRGAPGARRQPDRHRTAVGGGGAADCERGRGARVGRQRLGDAGRDRAGTGRRRRPAGRDAQSLGGRSSPCSS